MRRANIALVGSVAVLTAVLVVLVPDLPDPVATHFGGDGTADGFSPLATLWPTVLGIPTVVAMIVAAVTWTRGRRPPEGLRWATGMPVGVVWGVGGVIVATLLSQRGLADATTATIEPVMIVAALALAAVVTVAVARLVDLQDAPSTSAEAPAGALRADLPAGTTALWRGQTPTGQAALLVALGLLVVVATVIGMLAGWWVGALVLAAVVPLAASSRFRVTLGPGGLKVAGPLGGWPGLSVPLDTVTGASTTTIRPLEFGGWGIRMQPGGATTAVVTRAGPALRLDRTDGSAVVVSLDEADEAAAVVNSLLDQRGASTATGPSVQDRV